MILNRFLKITNYLLGAPDGHLGLFKGLLMVNDMLSIFI